MFLVSQPCAMKLRKDGAPEVGAGVEWVSWGMWDPNDPAMKLGERM